MTLHDYIYCYMLLHACILYPPPMLLIALRVLYSAVIYCLLQVFTCCIFFSHVRPKLYCLLRVVMCGIIIKFCIICCILPVSSISSSWQINFVCQTCMWQSLQIKNWPLQPALQNPSTAALTSSKSMSPPPIVANKHKHI